MCVYSTAHSKQIVVLIYSNNLNAKFFVAKKPDKLYANLYDDKAIAVKLCSKIDSLVKVNCHQWSCVGDLDLKHRCFCCFEKHNIIRLSLVEQTPPVKSNWSEDIISNDNFSHLKLRTCLGESLPQKSGMNLIVMLYHVK